MTNIYSHLKIIDLSRVFSGPFATRHFADFGAEVIKIESPSGDDSRQFAPIIGNWSGYFEILNRNKTSLILDLKNPQQLQVFYQLCKTADVLVENFSPQVKSRLKISYQDIQRHNPTIIYASISGISEQVDRKYYDVIAQAESGLTSLNGELDDMKVATSIVDAFGGMKLAYAISSALFSREKNQQGCQISVSMLGCAFDLLEQNLIQASISHKNPSKVGNMDSAIAPFGLFKTKDGSIALAIGNNTQWKTFVSFFGKHKQKLDTNHFQDNDSRLRHLRELQNTIENIFFEYNTTQILEILQDIQIPCGVSKKMLDIIGDPENYNQNLIEKINHPDVGEFVVPTGGIFFSNHPQEPYLIAPMLPEKT